MKSELNIAVAAQDAELVARHIEQTLGLQFQGHDSEYKGSYERHVGADGSNIEVSYNEDPMFQHGDPPDEKYFEPAFKSFRVLVRAFTNPVLSGQLFPVVLGGFPNSVIISANDAQQSVAPEKPAFASLRRFFR